MKITKNVFKSYFEKYLMFGTLVNRVGEDGGAGSGSTDQMGGRISETDSRDGSGASSDDRDVAGDVAAKTDAKADAKTDEGTADKKTGDGATTKGPDQISVIDKKINDLMSLIKSGRAKENTANKSNDKGVSSLEQEDLVAMLAEDPTAFLSKVTSIVEESVSDRLAQEKASEKIAQTINTYADANPDFEEMWDKGILKDFMENNPGHNAISAHMFLTYANKIEEAKKQGADEAIKNYSVKQNNQVLNGSPTIPGDKRDDALKNPNKFGGKLAVLAARAGLH